MAAQNQAPRAGFAPGFLFAAQKRVAGMSQNLPPPFSPGQFLRYQNASSQLSKMGAVG
jgi:hypothetical protein